MFWPRHEKHDVWDPGSMPSARTLSIKWTLSKKMESVVRLGTVLCIHLEKAEMLPEALAQ